MRGGAAPSGERRRPLSRAAGLSLALLACGGGCGYALVGRGITSDPSISKIAVPLFKDQTGRIGLDTRVTAAVTEELLKRGRFKVVRDTEGVDAVVEGEIVGYNVTPVNFSTSAEGAPALASRYATTLTVKIVYRKTGQQEPLWASDAFSQRDEYEMGERAEIHFDREEQSMDRLAQAFAHSVVAAMLEAF